MPRQNLAKRALRTVGGAAALALAWSATALAAGPTEITIPGDRTYPESITGAADGTLIIGSLGEGGVWRVPPGASEAELWIKPGANDSMSTLGVLADDKTNTLYVCSSDLSAMGAGTPGGKPVALKMFDLKTGEAKGSVDLPDKHSLCNDIAIGPHGSAYVTDSFNPHVLRLKPGAKEFEVWATDPRFSVKDGAGLDGIAFGADGNLYVNLYNGNKLFRIDVNSDRSAGKITELQPSQPIALCDGMRKFGNDLLMIEGTGKLDQISVDGDRAEVKVLKSGWKVPVSVWQVGDVGWVLEGQLGSLFNPKVNGKPHPFRAYAVPLPQASKM
jgi:sugar lactone lactonase YvrE